jgi:polysaccharide biosynthesis protein PslG
VATIVSGVRTRFSKAAGALALAACLLAWGAPAGGAAPRATSAATSALLGGVNIGSIGDHASLATADKLIASAHALHAKVVRTELPWSAFEPLGPGSIDDESQAYADRLIGDASAVGIHVILTVDSTPCWASSAPASLLRACNPARAGAANAWPPTKPADYAAFVAYLASRYGTQLAAIEIWNEPDQANEAYFAGPKKAERYAAVLRAAYPAIKAANPKVPVLGGSLVGPNGAFLRALYAAGIKGFYDGLAVHFYTLTLGSVRAIHEVQLANGDHTRLWLNEFGWSSCSPQRIQQEQACVTTQTQAANLSNTIRSLARAPYVAAAVDYKLLDSLHEDFGLMTTSGARKPAFAAVAGALASPFGSIARVSLSLRRKGTHVVASGTGPVGDFMRLEVFNGKLLRYHAVFTLDRSNRYSITLPSALGTSGLNVSVYQYWAGPGKAARKSV